MALSEQEILALGYLAAGADPFAGCSHCGDFGKRMTTLAALRRAGVIDHANKPTALGRTILDGEDGGEFATG